MAYRAFDRRTFLAAAAGSVAAFAATACGVSDLVRGASETGGRLQIRLTSSSVRQTKQNGVVPLGVTDDRDTLLFVPRSAIGLARVPIMVNLHGAGGGQEAALRRYRDEASRRGVALVMPASRGRTWDAVLGAFGPDVELIERSLEAAADRVPIDTTRVAVAGYSDGASYALSIGITNGDLFTHVIANSPGFIPMPDPHGHPRIFVSHGTRDRELPVASTSDEIVANLREDGYDTTYARFNGTHTLPPNVAGHAVEWFVG